MPMPLLSSTLTLAADNPAEHVVNHPFIVTSDGWWVWSSHIGNLVLTGVIMLLFFPYIASRIRTGDASLGASRYLPRGATANLVEVILVYLRDKVVHPLLHGRTDRFMPLLWTLFFFILINNLLGLVPIIDLIRAITIFATGNDTHSVPVGGTATGNIWVTGALALVAMIVYIAQGMVNLGPKTFLAHMTGGAPWFVWPIMVPIELAGTFIIKPGALAVRLFANMTAGHLLIATLLMFVGMAFRALPVWGWGPISFVSIGAAVALYFLELFVAFLQAFVFMFLLTIFISQLSHHDSAHEAHDHKNHELTHETPASSMPVGGAA